MDYDSKVFLLLGGNDGENTKKAFQLTHDFLAATYQSELKFSNIYQSPPWGYESDKSYYNQVLVFRSNESPRATLNRLLDEERRLGRVRKKGEGYSDRVIDIDIIYFGTEVIEEQGLILPHPRMHLRRFTLLPLCEVAPNFVHPVLKLTNKELLIACNDESKVTKEA